MADAAAGAARAAVGAVRTPPPPGFRARRLPRAIAGVAGRAARAGVGAVRPGGVCAGVVLLVAGVLGVAAPAYGDGRWRLPLDGSPAVLRGFDPPDLPWGAGHRGIDLAASAGEPVYAAGAGRIGYVGRIAGRGIVTVLHDTRRTTYLPVRATVRPGDRVHAGSRIGTVEPGIFHCPMRVCLHWGLLRGETYLDPLSLLGGGPIRLLPLHSSRPTAATSDTTSPPLTSPPTSPLGAKPAGTRPLGVKPLRAEPLGARPAGGASGAAWTGLVSTSTGAAAASLAATGAPAPARKPPGEGTGRGDGGHRASSTPSRGPAPRERPAAHFAESALAGSGGAGLVFLVIAAAARVPRRRTPRTGGSPPRALGTAMSYHPAGGRTAPPGAAPPGRTRAAASGTTPRPGRTPTGRIPPPTPGTGGPPPVGCPGAAYGRHRRRSALAARIASLLRGSPGPDASGEPPTGYADVIDLATERRLRRPTHPGDDSA